MARQKQLDNFDMIVEILQYLPFWIGPLVALAAFLLVRYGAPMLFPAPTSEVDPNIILRQLMPMLSWFAGGFILLAWLFAEGLKLRNRVTCRLRTNKERPSPIKKTRNSSTLVEPRCPRCGANMVVRVAKKGTKVGNEFWGCSKFPDCRGILPIDE